MVIRRATFEDKDQLLNLFNQFEEYYQKNHILSKDLQAFEEEKDQNQAFETSVNKYLTDPNYFTLVAELEGKLIGYISGKSIERLRYIMDRKGFIEDWFVLEEFRGKGIGKQLLTKIIELFKQDGCTHLELSVYTQNREAITVYNQLGFISVDIIMVKKI
jgi:PhnO protein